jgi:proline dehydrogenase
MAMGDFVKLPPDLEKIADELSESQTTARGAIEYLWREEYFTKFPRLMMSILEDNIELRKDVAALERSEETWQGQWGVAGVERLKIQAENSELRAEVEGLMKDVFKTNDRVEAAIKQRDAARVEADQLRVSLEQVKGWLREAKGE